jgi:hypothetical protein
VEPSGARDEDGEPLVHVGWYCWRCHGINSAACRSDCVPVYVPAGWQGPMKQEIAARETGENEW